MTLPELRVFLADQTTHWKSDLAHSTQVDYQRILRAVGDDFIVFLRSAPNSTFGKRRCAILWRLRFLLAETIVEIEEAIRRGEMDQTWRLQKANVYADLVKKVAAEKRVKSRTQVGKSKKIGLKALSKQGDFRLRLAAAAGKAGRLAILVLAVAGVRPAELQKGILVKEEGDHNCAIHIGGAKFTENTGHEFRIQTHDARLSKLGAKLLEAVREAGGKLLIRRKASLLMDDVKAAARRAKLPPTVSPYSLRHQFAADLKAAGWSDVDIAKAMGHSSTRTAGRYGRKTSGSSSGGSMVSVWASGKVNEPSRPVPEISSQGEASIDLNFGP